MSGSGGGGDGDFRESDRPAPRPGQGSGGGDVGPDDPCHIVEITNLNSVDRAVVAGLRPGDSLALVYEVGPPQRLVATTAAGAIAGSITSPSMLQLIQCMLAGNAYVATVLVVRGAQVQVRIEPR
jgi:hypothetical protein